MEFNWEEVMCLDVSNRNTMSARRQSVGTMGVVSLGLAVEWGQGLGKVFLGYIELHYVRLTKDWLLDFRLNMQKTARRYISVLRINNTCFFRILF